MLKEIYILFYYFFKSEWVKKERLISPLLFAAVVIILFHFIFGEDLAQSASVYVGEVFLILILVLQITLLRQFDIEREDGAIDYLKTSSVYPFSIFLAKFCLNFFLAIFSFVAILAFTGLINSKLTFDTQQYYLFFLIVFFFCSSCSSLGTLVSAVVSSVTGREILFPLLFYPLLVPVLILGVQTSLMVFVSHLSFQDIYVYILYLGGINLIYFVMGMMLFGELMS